MFQVLPGSIEVRPPQPTKQQQQTKKTHKKRERERVSRSYRTHGAEERKHEIRRRTAAPASQQQQQQKFTEQINIIMTTRALALTLYRNLMKQATTMSDYNFRSYAIRRVRVGYHKHRTSTGYVQSIHSVERQSVVHTTAR